MNEPTTETARRVRAALEEAGLTQVELAATLGIPQPAISQRYLGKRPWRAHELHVISERHGIPIEKLFAPVDTHAQAAQVPA